MKRCNLDYTNHYTQTKDISSRHTLHDNVKILAICQKQLQKLRARKGISRARAKQEVKFIVNEAAVTKKLKCHILYDIQYCTYHNILEIIERKIRETDKLSEKT